MIERTIHQQLKSFLNSANILYSAQHGFRSKKSNCSALLELLSRLAATKNSSKFSIIATLDYSRAFDAINNDIMMRKLSRHFDADACSWFASYLQCRRQYVYFNGIMSDMQATMHGIPQGSIMASTLFLLYIYDLFCCLPSDSVIAYADDITLLASGKTLELARGSLQDLLDTVCRWSTENCLRLNPTKCASTVFATSN